MSRRYSVTPTDYIQTMRLGCDRAATARGQRKKAEGQLQLRRRPRLPVIFDEEEKKMAGAVNDFLTKKALEGRTAGKGEGGGGWLDPSWSSAFSPHMEINQHLPK